MGLAGLVLVVSRRQEPLEARRGRARMVGDLPFAAELMVACLRAGQPLGGAVETTAAALGGPLGERLAYVGARIRLGADPDAAWAALGDERHLGSFARAMRRAAAGGAPVADVLTRLADDARHEARAAAAAAARKVGVQAIAPLGLCFLPAFVLIGIIPTIAGFATEVLSL
jgi:pilus assembly protein TadC